MSPTDTAICLYSSSHMRVSSSRMGTTVCLPLSPRHPLQYLMYRRYSKKKKISCNMSKFCSLFCTALGSRTIQCTDQESHCSQYTLITSFQFPAHKQCYQSLQHRSMGIKKMVNKTKCTVAAH